jgi:hypothetical protein
MNQDSLRVRANIARILGWISVALGIASAALWLLPPLLGAQGIGRALGLGISLGLAMPLVALVAVVVNPSEPKSRPALPALTLVLGVVIATVLLFLLSGLADLGRMR